MIICSFNTKNAFFKHKNKNDMLYKIIDKYKVDILCVQETIYKDLKEFEYKNFKSYGLGRLKKSNSVFNETNNIITNIKLEDISTNRLPSYLTTFKRIFTVATFTKNNKKICIINTHLDFLNNISRKMQLKKIQKYIKSKYKRYEIILTGDFNTSTNEKYFINFIDELKKINIELVKNNLPTILMKKHKLPIDHIFISNSLIMKSFNVINNDEIIDSDHYPIIIDLDI